MSDKSREKFEKLGGLITTTRYELTHFLSASNYSEGTIIDVDKKYSIEIIYGEHKTPALKKCSQRL